ADLIHQGVLRADLYHRFTAGALHLLPLRERGDDPLDLVRHFAREAAAAHSLPKPTLDATLSRRILRHSWPGNVRELQNVVLRYAATGELRFLNEEERGEEFSEQIPAPDEDLNLALYMEKAERNCILAAIRACGGRKDRAAAKLGVNLRTFHRRCAKLGIFLKDRE
ncbi:MAG: helix-turn-helix domain-containing protein, partial [Desulfovibrionaceae bacterium]|nr:helix-turn-helix domain-containing protein [Desulfovibrionaceae bacterium]